MTKYKTTCSEELKSKNRAYWCWICNSRNVQWDGTLFVCKKCGTEHKTVKEIVYAQSKKTEEVSGN